ncbi:MAG: CYTH domain-containing protein [Gemmatimonadota bacterium]
MREIELKAVVSDERAVRARLAAAGAVPVFAGTLRDRRYDTAARSLRARDEVLRMRLQRDAAGERAVLEYKSPTEQCDGYKIREETGSEVQDATALDGILRALGFEVTREVDREVAVFAVAGATVRLERYPRMDLLVEVEGDPACIEAAIAVLAMPRATFTADPLSAFVRRFEARTGGTAAICDRELAGDFRFRLDDA